MFRFPQSLRLPALMLAFSAPMLGLAATLARAAPAPAPTVAIKMFAFTPQILTVAPGTMVTWTNADDDPHTITASDRSFHSAALDTGGRYSFTFAKPGTYAYFCSLHPRMTGKIVVKAD